MVSMLGMGGIGKSALAVSLMHQVAAHFEVVLWRSLRDAPECSALLEECLQVLAPQPLREVPASLEGRLSLLMEHLREQRSWCWTTWRACSRKVRAEGTCGPVTRAMVSCCARWAKRGTRVASC